MVHGSIDGFSAGESGVCQQILRRNITLWAMGVAFLGREGALGAQQAGVGRWELTLHFSASTQKRTLSKHRATQSVTIGS